MGCHDTPLLDRDVTPDVHGLREETLSLEEQMSWACILVNAACKIS